MAQMFGTPEIEPCRRGEDARFDVGAETHDHGRRVGNAQLSQRADIGGVDFGNMREGVGVLLHVLGVEIESESRVAHVDQRARERRSGDGGSMA